jgi:uncharacterized protein with PIN domain
MITMSVRFYAELNEFLPPQRRQRRFTHATSARASVKDVIEALGVPHPEVDLVVINGRPEPFSYLVADGDDISAYPVFRTIAVAADHRTGADPPRPVRFVLDVHLGKLASLLRLCGFDAELRAGDADVAEAAAREDRVALTRDVGLLKRNIVRHGYWVRHTDPERQLAEVVARFDLRADVDAFSRCLRCNTPVVAVSPGAIAHKLPPRTRMEFSDFRQCPTCERVYWQGSHYARLSRLVDRIRHGAV